MRHKEAGGGGDPPQLQRIRLHGVRTIERLIAEDDYVTVRATMHTTNDGKEATGSGLAEFRVAEGKIVEDWPMARWQT